MKRGIALVYGVICHTTFLVGVAWMVLGLATGMQAGLGRLEGGLALAADLALVVQFPLLHSFLLSRRGRQALDRLAPRALRRDLGTTLYAWAGSMQVLVVFACWSPTGIVWYQPAGRALACLWIAYGASWLLLMKAMWDASLALQTGAIGWFAVIRGGHPVFPSFPTHGLFRWWRQPIYTAFAAILLTAPVWTPDRLVLVAVWSAYCFLGPILKERRYAAMYGEPFRRYQTRHPYWLPMPAGVRRALRPFRIGLPR